MVARQKKTRQVAEFGDFQTPLALARATAAVLRNLGVKAQTIIEPTCGKGAFVVAALEAFPDATRIIGLDINPSHVEFARSAVSDLNNHSATVYLREGDFFKLNWSDILGPDEGPRLIIGNPPWVTSAELGSMVSQNLPEKSNFQNYTGIAAITGKSNFDISEWMLLRYIEWLTGTTGTIAVLCKTAVARKILGHVWRKGISISGARIYRINSLSHFGAAVEACFFVISLERGGNCKECGVFEELSDETPKHVIGFRHGHILRNVRTFAKRENLLGAESHYVWRSGIKHDCSKVMELAPVADGYQNGLGEVVTLEDNYLFPLLKSSDLGNGRFEYRNAMLVPQRFVGDNTQNIAKTAPNTWAYLTRHGEILSQRGSIIYKKQPPFAIFGVGDYSFAPWKIAISGFYKSINFRRIGLIRNRSVVFDDTVNFLACWSESEADFLFALLSSEAAQEFYQSMIHWDEKRPITVEILRRLSIRNLAIDRGRENEYNNFVAQRQPPLLQFLSASG